MLITEIITEGLGDSWTEWLRYPSVFDNTIKKGKPISSPSKQIQIITRNERP